MHVAAHSAVQTVAQLAVAQFVAHAAALDASFSRSFPLLLVHDPNDTVLKAVICC